MPNADITSELLWVLINRFDESELRDLCFEVHIDFENLPGARIADKARELVEHCRRHDSLPELEDKIRELRPKAFSGFGEALTARTSGRLTKPDSIDSWIQAAFNSCRSLAEIEATIERAQLHQSMLCQLVMDAASDLPEPRRQQIANLVKNECTHCKTVWADISSRVGNSVQGWLQFVTMNCAAEECDTFSEHVRTTREELLADARLWPKPSGLPNAKIVILFLASDPTDASRLRVDEELREIQEKLQLSKLRDCFDLQQRMSVRPADITQALLDVKPQVVHFAGHGTPMGELCFEDQIGETHPIQPDALGALFEQFADQVNCVVLNACYSEIQANAIAKHIDYVIGMNQAIDDKAGISFAIGFYQALGAGRKTDEAYEFGCVQIGLQQGITGHLRPVLKKKEQAQS